MNWFWFFDSFSCILINTVLFLFLAFDVMRRMTWKLEEMKVKFISFFSSTTKSRFGLVFCLLSFGSE